MIKDLVSVIVPVYNVEKYLRDCLNSILAQTYSNIEVILINDGSKDGSGFICDEYAAKDSRIKVLHKENGGVSKARNAGIRIARGEYLSFVDADDTLDCDYIGLMHREMVAGDFDFIRLSWERAGVNCTYKVRFDENGRYVVDSSNMDDLQLCENRWGLFRAEQNIFFNESLKNGEDSLYVIESFVKSRRKKFLLVNKPYYHYTVVADSASDLKTADRVIAHQKFLEQVLLLKNYYPSLERLVKKHEYSDFLSLMRYMIDYGVKSEKGFVLKDVERHIIALRKEGIKYSTFKSELRYFLYRYRLVSVFKILKFLKSKVIK